MPRPQGEKVVVSVFIGLRIDQISRLQRVCDSRHVSRSELVREAVDEWLLSHLGGKDAES